MSFKEQNQAQAGINVALFFVSATKDRGWATCSQATVVNTGCMQAPTGGSRHAVCTHASVMTPSISSSMH